MKEKLPVQFKKDNIFKRFINFIIHKIKKKQYTNDDNSQPVIIEPEKNINQSTDTNTLEQYKVDNAGQINSNAIKAANQTKTLEEIIQIIEKEPSMLEKLDIDKLKIIDQYYDNEIKRYNVWVIR